MREIKFKIVYQHDETGRIAERLIGLGESFPDLGPRWFIIAKRQYTGLKDKNGVEIYEGDIINWNEDTLCEIIYEFNKFGARDIPKPSHGFARNNDYNWMNAEDLEVIGNIYESPELLSAEKEKKTTP